MSVSQYIRDDQADIRVTVDGVAVGDGNSWVTYDGGGKTASGSKTRPGGMGKEKEVGSFASRANATLTTQNSDALSAQHTWLESRIGKGNIVVTITYLDEEGNVRTGEGSQDSYTGKLLGAVRPNSNGEASTVGMYTITAGLDED